MRNIQKQKEQGLKIIDRCHTLDLTAGEFEQLLNIYHEAEARGDDPLWEIITASFLTGLAAGTRYGKKEAADRRDKQRKEDMQEVLAISLMSAKLFQGGGTVENLVDAHRQIVQAGLAADILHTHYGQNTEATAEEIQTAKHRIEQMLITLVRGIEE